MACRRLSSALDQATEILAILEAETGTVLHANAAFSRTFGNPSHWAMDQKLLDFFQADQESRILATALEEGREGSVWSGPCCLKTHAGKRITFEGTLSPVRDGAGAVEALVVRLRDVTHEVEQDRQLRQAQRLGALGALAGGVAHDFNNLINAILGAAELIEMEIEPHSPILRKVEIIQQVCGRARELSTQILKCGRRTDEKWTSIDLSSLVAEVANLLHTTLPANVKVVSDLTRGIKVLGDPSQLHQVIMNLCINGSQAMYPDGGVLTIRLLPVAADPEPGGQMPSPRVQLSVEDSGCGMDPTTLERIFEPFFTTKEAGQGTGLGLSLVNGIIQGLGGSLQVTSKPGQGSCFQIFLPLYQERRKGLNGTTKGSSASSF